jgi:hypothetical protein
MARNVLLGLTIGCSAAAGLGQAAKKDPARITISTENTTVVGGAPICVNTQLQNNSDHPLTVGTAFINGIIMSYSLRRA